MNDSLDKAHGFIQRLIRISSFARPVREDPNRACSNFVKTITRDDEGEVRYIGPEQNLCGCTAMLNERNRPLGRSLTVPLSARVAP